MQAQIKGVINQMRAATNPQAYLNQMLLQNPQIAQVMQWIKQNGNNPQNAFYAQARAMGIDPQQVLNLLQ